MGNLSIKISNSQNIENTRNQNIALCINSSHHILSNFQKIGIDTCVKMTLSSALFKLLGTIMCLSEIC